MITMIYIKGASEICAYIEGSLLISLCPRLQGHCQRGTCCWWWHWWWHTHPVKEEKWTWAAQTPTDNLLHHCDWYCSHAAPSPIPEKTKTFFQTNEQIFLEVPAWTKHLGRLSDLSPFDLITPPINFNSTTKLKRDSRSIHQVEVPIIRSCEAINQWWWWWQWQRTKYSNYDGDFCTCQNNVCTWQNNCYTCQNNFPTCQNNFSPKLFLAVGKSYLGRWTKYFGRWKFFSQVGNIFSRLENSFGKIMIMMMMMETKSLPPGPVQWTVGVGLPSTSHLHFPHKHQKISRSSSFSSRSPQWKILAQGGHNRGIPATDFGRSWNIFLEKAGFLLKSQKFLQSTSRVWVTL